LCCIVLILDDPFNPSFLKIDRILDEGEMNGEVFYLVKWCSIQYDESTWESTATVNSIDDEKIAEYYARGIPSQDKLNAKKNFKRPDAKKWKKIEQSPK